MNLEEKLLIWRFNRGDGDAVRVMYEKYKHELLTVAAALLKNSAMAEDVVHDVFMGFLELKEFRLTGSLKGYLATCVANAARNLIRANNVREYEPLDEALPAEVDHAGPAQQAMFGEESRLLGEAIAELPYEQREVVILHLRGGLTFAEIAQLQNVSINTVQGRYRYGLEKIKSKLNSEVSQCNPMTLSKN